MRRLLWFSLGFGGICWLWAYELWLPSGWLLAAALGIAMAGGRKVRTAALAFWVILGCIGASGWVNWFAQRQLAPIAQWHEKTEKVTLSVTDFSVPGPFGMMADGVISIGEKKYPVRAYLKGEEGVKPGDQLTGEFLFRRTTPDAMNTHHAKKGIFLLAYQRGEVVKTQSRERTWQNAPALLRQRLKTTLSTYFSPEAAAFSKAVGLGDDSDLSYRVDTDLKVSGIRHITAVSGLHISILFALISNVTFHRRYATALLGIPVLVILAAVTGFTPSVCRACMMAGLMMLAQLLNREYDGPTALAFAGLVMMLRNPLVMANVGFQLSVASVAGIFLFQPRLYVWLMSFSLIRYGKKLWRLVSASISVTLGAMAFTTPLCAWYFGTVSLVGILTNLLTLWAVGLIFYGVLATCAAAFFWHTGAVYLANITTFFIGYVVNTAEILADFPLAAIYTQSPYVVAWLVFVYVLLGAFLLTSRKEAVTLLCCGTLGLCLALGASFLEPMLDQVRITMLDVGQGQCLLIQTEGRSYLVDCGGEQGRAAADLAAQTLLSQGITQLDGAILTHDDDDHSNGLGLLLSRIDTKLLILPPMGTQTPIATQGQVVYGRENLEILLPQGKIRIFAPGYLGNHNETSLCVLFQSEKCDILITGDRSFFGERTLLRQQEIPAVDVLVAGHHGAANATCRELLMQTRPEIVCISAGRDNPYGHPAPELLERLKEFGCKVYRTDKNGTILIRR